MSAWIPWEDSQGKLVDRFWTTIWSATSDPINTFARLGEGPAEPELAPSARLAILASLIGWSPFILLAPCLALLPFAFASALPERARDLGLLASFGIALAMPFVFVFGSVAVEIVHAAIFHVIATLAGGVGTSRASLRAMLYTAAIRFWLLPALFLSMVPFVGTMIHLSVRGAFILWSGFACFGAARGVHRLDDNRALLVAILTPLLSIGLVSFVIALCVFALVTAFAGTLGLGDLLGMGR